ncbi:MAG TPA: ATP-binding protein [Pirellulales bacterium]|nr:ATP-binding protein [Pirellulales bacterium]
MLQRLAEKMLNRFGPHYILGLMWVTRACASIGGLLLLYYVNLSLKLPDQIRYHFEVASLILVAFAVTVTVFLALWETRHLREVIRRIRAGKPVEGPLGQEAGREAVIFSGRHHRYESWVVPCTTLAPLLLYLKIVDNASITVLINVSLAAVMATVMVLMSTYFLIGSCMRPVIGYLLRNGVAVEFDSIPVSKLRARMNISFALIILTTSLMIGTLANQRATDMVGHPENQAEAVTNLRQHTSYITIAAVLIGLVFSTVLAQSVAVRVRELVDSMKRVQTGDLSARLTPTGNDEIDIVTRQFNEMVTQLDRNDHTIRDLNSNLEKKVKNRTRQLSKKKRELQVSFRQLQEHDRLKTQFFSNVSHELRTPLTMILAPLEELITKRRQQLSGDASYMLEVALVNGRRLLDLINRLLEFSKLEAGHAQLCLSPVNLNEMINELATSARPLAQQRQIALEVDLDPDVPVIGGDVDKMDSVITNLLSNALKFTPVNGTVQLRTRRDDSRVCIYVRDSGIGIAPEDHARVFERFVQLDGSTARKYSGTGLGLSLVKELVELHGGKIQIDSEVGKGATFWFWLPITEPPSEAARQVSAMARSCRFADLVTCESEEPAAVEPVALPAGTPTILVADDTPEMRRLLVSVLKDEYTVVTAEDGEQGSQLAEQIMPDIILSDVMMPVTDGYEFCRRIKGNPAMARIPFVLLTAKADRTMKIEGLDIGADDYLVKPFDAEELRARVRSLLRLRALDRKLDERNAELERTLTALQNTQSQMMQMAHLAGMTEIATGVLHNVGNVLNNVNISTTVLGERLRQLRIDGLAKVVKLFDEHTDDLESFLANDRRGRQVKEYLASLSKTLAADQQELLGELSFLSDKVQHIRNIIVAEQNYAKRVSFKEQCDLSALIEDVLLMRSHSLQKNRIEVLRDFEPLPPMVLERSKLLQVIENLVKNAIESIASHDGPNRRIGIGLKLMSSERVRLTVTDSGRGIEPEHANRIFNFGFTTKKSGNGFGLHHAANAMTEMGGKISAHSDGLGHGATFTLEIPLVNGSSAAEIAEDAENCESSLIAV